MRREKFPGKLPGIDRWGLRAVWYTGNNSRKGRNVQRSRRFHGAPLPEFHAMGCRDQHQYRWKVLIHRPAFCTFTITEQTPDLLFEPSCIGDLGIKQHEQAIPVFLGTQPIFCPLTNTEQQGRIGSTTHRLLTVRKLMGIVTYPVPSYF